MYIHKCNVEMEANLKVAWSSVMASLALPLPREFCSDFHLMNRCVAVEADIANAPSWNLFFTGSSPPAPPGQV